MTTHGRGAAWWAAAAVTAVNALTSAGFSIAGLVSTAGLPGDAAARVFAMYAAARSLALVAVVLPLVLFRSTRALGVLGIVLGLVQAGDALVGIAQHDLSKTIGPAVLATLTLAGVRGLLRGDRHRPAA